MQKGQFSQFITAALTNKQKVTLGNEGRDVFRPIKCVFLFHVTPAWPSALDETVQT